jgi:hypothetical protein
MCQQQREHTVGHPISGADWQGAHPAVIRTDRADPSGAARVERYLYTVVQLSAAGFLMLSEDPPAIDLEKIKTFRSYGRSSAKAQRT